MQQIFYPQTNVPVILAAVRNGPARNAFSSDLDGDLTIKIFSLCAHQESTSRQY